MKLAYSFMIIMPLMASLSNHPMAMGILLFLQTLMTCILMSSVYKTSWLSLILFIVFLGGMLVLFIYVISLASNELMTMSNLVKLSLFSSVMVMLMLIIHYDSILSMTMNWDSIDKSNMLNHNLMMTNQKLFNAPTNLITLWMVGYLFFTLVVVVKVSNLESGPIRSIK